MSLLFKKVFVITLLVIVTAFGGQVAMARAAGPAQSGAIQFSPNSMVTRGPLTLTLSGAPAGATIRYTTNGSLPQANSTPYTAPIPIGATTVVRAQVFNSAGSPLGDSVTKSYIIAGYEQTLPVISIATDWAYLNELHAFPENRGREWERPIVMEYFAPGGQSQFNVNAGLRIHGGKSRAMSPKKSYRVYFRKTYGGPGNLDYPLFADSPVTRFDKLVLRAGFNDSFTNLDTSGIPDPQVLHAKYIGDQVVRNLHRDMGQPIAHGDWVLLYLNGEYWGLYNLTERVDMQFLRQYSDKNAEWDVIKKEVGFTPAGEWYSEEVVVDGGYDAWLSTQNWVGSADFYNPGNIGVLEWMVDTENLFSYMALQAYVQNYDWPGNNWIIYRRSDPGATGHEGQWRLMVWDAEYSFGSGSQGFKTDLNTVERVHSPHDSITRLLEKPFIGSCAFKHRFVERAREYLGVENRYGKPATEVGQLAKERVKAEITAQAEKIRPFMQLEIDRWAPTMNLATFDQNIANALHFVDVRQEVFLHHLDILRYQAFTSCR